MKTTPPEQLRARAAGAVAFSDSDGTLYCTECAGSHRGLTPQVPHVFSLPDRCSNCYEELRGPLKAGRYHEYERQTVRELGTHLEPWPIDDAQRR